MWMAFGPSFCSGSVIRTVDRQRNSRDICGYLDDIEGGTLLAKLVQNLARILTVCRLFIFGLGLKSGGVRLNACERRRDWKSGFVGPVYRWILDIEGHLIV